MRSVQEQIISFALRALLMMIGALLVSHGVVTKETADSVAPGIIEHLIGIALIVAPLIKTGFRAQKNVEIQEKAIQIATKSDPNTPVSVVKQRVLNEIRGQK